MKDETTHCKGIAKDDGRVEQEKSKDEAAEFSGFRRRWRLLGWVVRSQRERERKRETERKRKRKQNGEKEDVRRKERGQENVGCRYGQDDGGRRRAKRSREWSRERNEKADEGSNEESRICGGQRRDQEG